MNKKTVRDIDLKGKRLFMRVDFNVPMENGKVTDDKRIRAALPYVPPERLLLAPDCGMKFLSRDIAYRKLRAMVLGAEIVREELQS